MERLPYPLEVPREPGALAPSGPGSLPNVWRRGAARILDSLIVAPFLVGFLYPYAEFSSDGALELTAPLAVNIAVLILPLLYETLMLMAGGATIGKRIMGLRVVRYVDAGHPAPYQVVLRVLMPAIGDVGSFTVKQESVGTALGLIPMLVYMSSLFDPLLRGIHDKAAGTVVLSTK